MSVPFRMVPADQVKTVGTGFSIGVHDRITINGKAFRLNRYVGEDVELVPADGIGLAEQFPMSNLSRLSTMGRVKHEVGYYLPADLRPAVGLADVSFRVSDLPDKPRARFFSRYAHVMAVEELGIRNNTIDIEESRDKIEKLIKPYFQEVASQQQMLEHERKNRSDRRIEKAGRKQRGGKPEVTVTLFSSDTIRKFVAEYRKHGLSALVDNLSHSGNRTSAYRPEVLGLMMELVQASYLTTERKTKKQTVQDVRRGFRKENQRREAENRDKLAAERVELLDIPGRDAILSTIGKLDFLKVLIARWGRDHAIKKLRSVAKGVQVSRPGERVEIDEWRIDLISMIFSAKLNEVFGEDFIKALELNGEKARWWLVLAIDCRTKVILGAKLTRNPTTSAARECLRMVMSDKGQWADDVGALSPWPYAVIPELLVSDNGPAFKADLFSSTCMDLGMSFLRTIGGIPGMRGTVERVFYTAALDLMPRLRGRTFSNPRERGDYPATDRACLDASDVAFALVRWIVDIYHNSPHAGLGGLTPREQWEADISNGNYPLRALPDTRSKRLAFGLRDKRKISRSGIVVMGIKYHNRELGAWFIRPGSKVVDVRWDAEDLGAIEVFLDGEWREIPAVHERFAGVNLHVWLTSRRALRARSAGRKAWDEEAVFRAIDEIEALSAHKAAVFGLLDTSISEKEFKHLEASLFSSFDIADGGSLLDDGEEPGQEIPPCEPARTEKPATAQKAKSTAAKPAAACSPKRAKPARGAANPKPKTINTNVVPAPKWVPVKKEVK
ncbi:Mu transposase C-terminal domain-containing protein [Mameliella sp. AT18]|uniref:Mu transposase C-terminal domain-containing protein n=1 Tax=Mameliella sp. AT18 TaxID=3028385 RepID=UPI000A8A177E|nr:Mu transposase C-terminal domain-containing protein [Mameliella sp. AT18]MDD9733805.1 Mu transposase C-terminal domain-containing protein [Mameliella sp. AT18]